MKVIKQGPGYPLNTQTFHRLCFARSTGGLVLSQPMVGVGGGGGGVKIRVPLNAP